MKFRNGPLRLQLYLRRALLELNRREKKRKNGKRAILIEASDSKNMRYTLTPNADARGKRKYRNKVRTWAGWYISLKEGATGRDAGHRKETGAAFGPFPSFVLCLAKLLAFYAR